LKPGPWNSLQKRALIVQPWILLDVLLNLFLEILDLALDLVKEVLVSPPNCFIFGFLQSARGSGSFPSGGPAGPL
jgi:hypothetical protein